MDVNFKFELDDIVTNPLGGRGVINCLGFDSGGNQYALKNIDGNATWWSEQQLTLVKKD